MNINAITTTQEAQKGFYPTPPELADKLLAGIDWHYVATVLEPSAGKGDLVKAVAQKAHSLRYGETLSVDCVEIDPYLRSILEYEFGGRREDEIRERRKQLNDKESWNAVTRTKGELTPMEAAEKRRLEREYDWLHKLSAPVVHDDFLNFQSRKHYDLIVMNPPFADGDAHLLKAIELQRRWGGQIRCLLNADTLLNPCTNRRKVLESQLAELGAEMEYIEGGFANGERATGVTVALIKIAIPQVNEDSDIFQRLSEAAHLDEESARDVTDMAVTDFMEQIVSRFNVEVDAGLELIREYRNMRPYLLDSFDKEDKFGFTTLTLCAGDPSKSGGRGSVPSVNKFLGLVRKKYWSALFSNKEFVCKLTSNLREKYRGMVAEMVKYDFTLFNIQKIAAQMNAEMGRGIQDTIVELFDKMTEKHTWYPEMEKNIHYYNGWKTNKAHKLGMKVILPIYGVFSSWSREAFELYEAEKTISDIEKVFDYLDGNMTAHVNLHGVLQTACNEGQTRNIPCKFFDVTLYKKGTMHIKFRNQELVDRFNIYCCKHKGWLPPSYGKARYSNMQATEKAVVDSFHGDGKEGSGESGYNVVMARADYFLSEPVQELPMLMAGA
ncbi:MAG: DUF4942 domain-containing protein [Acutalibacter sp.]|jgi:hypothetical protein|uniref:DUF4942 domain-containing protein n=1 Tax=Acutalibacter sp. TaxID=1918636 RepID=UPI0021748DEC|nr:DUF4942 domain-containing protein [Acutalibacter sp.]MCI9225015.1 DUF4942 domain-containing protein [Acutalibacter sp.]